MTNNLPFPRRRLVDDNVKLEVIALRDLVVGGDGPAVNVEDGLLGPLRLARPGPLGGAAVVLGQGLDAGDVVGEAGDGVDPGLVVVDAHGDEEGLLALLRLEAEHARGAAVAHGQGVDAVVLAPLGALGVVPAALLHDVEVGVGVALVDADLDGVRHSVKVLGKGVWRGIRGRT